MKDYTAIIKKNIREYRKARGLTQIELSELMGKANSSVCTWESATGNLMSADTLFQLCDILGVSADDIGGRSTNLPSEDRQLITAFHSANPGIKEGVCKLLDILPAKKGDNRGTISEEKSQADLNNTIIMEDPVS